MISRTISWISRYLDLTAEEQVIPRKLESINPTLVIPLEYFWEQAGPTVREIFTVDHSAAGVDTIMIDFKNDLDTLLIDWTWTNVDATDNYFINLDLLDIDKVNQTTIYRERITGVATPGLVTRTSNDKSHSTLTPNQMTLPRLIRSTESLTCFVDDGGVLATANVLTIRTVSFPKNGPLPRLAF